MGSLGLEETHFATNLAHFKQDNLSPSRILEVQKLVWAELGIHHGGMQRTRA